MACDHPTFDTVFTFVYLKKKIFFFTSLLFSLHTEPQNITETVEKHKEEQGAVFNSSILLNHTAQADVIQHQ